MEKTEADYKNWVPAGMIRGFLLGSAAAKRQRRITKTGCLLE